MLKSLIWKVWARSRKVSAWCVQPCNRRVPKIYGVTLLNVVHEVKSQWNWCLVVYRLSRRKERDRCLKYSGEKINLILDCSSKVKNLLPWMLGSVHLCFCWQLQKKSLRRARETDEQVRGWFPGYGYVLMSFHHCTGHANPVVYNRCTGLVDWTGGLDSWTGTLDTSDAAITLVIAGIMYFMDSRTELEIAFKQ